MARKVLYLILLVAGTYGCPGLSDIPNNDTGSNDGVTEQNIPVSTAEEELPTTEQMPEVKVGDMNGGSAQEIGEVFTSGDLRIFEPSSVIQEQTSIPSVVGNLESNSTDQAQKTVAAVEENDVNSTDPDLRLSIDTGNNRRGSVYANLINQYKKKQNNNTVLTVGENVSVTTDQPEDSFKFADQEQEVDNSNGQTSDVITSGEKNEAVSGSISQIQQSFASAEKGQFQPDLLGIGPTQQTIITSEQVQQPIDLAGSVPKDSTTKGHDSGLIIQENQSFGYPFVIQPTDGLVYTGGAIIPSGPEGAFVSNGQSPNGIQVNQYDPSSSGLIFASGEKSEIFTGSIGQSQHSFASSQTGKFEQNSTGQIQDTISIGNPGPLAIFPSMQVQKDIVPSIQDIGSNGNQGLDIPDLFAQNQGSALYISNTSTGQENTVSNVQVQNGVKLEPQDQYDSNFTGHITASGEKNTFDSGTIAQVEHAFASSEKGYEPNTTDQVNDAIINNQPSQQDIASTLQIQQNLSSSIETQQDFGHKELTGLNGTENHQTGDDSNQHQDIANGSIAPTLADKDQQVTTDIIKQIFGSSSQVTPQGSVQVEQNQQETISNKPIQPTFISSAQAPESISNTGIIQHTFGISEQGYNPPVEIQHSSFATVDKGKPLKPDGIHNDKHGYQNVFFIPGYVHGYEHTSYGHVFKPPIYVHGDKHPFYGGYPHHDYKHPGSEPDHHYPGFEHIHHPDCGHGEKQPSFEHGHRYPGFGQGHKHHGFEHGHHYPGFDFGFKYPGYEHDHKNEHQGFGHDKHDCEHDEYDSGSDEDDDEDDDDDDGQWHPEHYGHHGYHGGHK